VGLTHAEIEEARGGQAHAHNKKILKNYKISYYYYHYLYYFYYLPLTEKVQQEKLEPKTS